MCGYTIIVSTDRYPGNAGMVSLGDAIRASLGELGFAVSSDVRMTGEREYTVTVRVPGIMDTFRIEMLREKLVEDTGNSMRTAFGAVVTVHHPVMVESHLERKSAPVGDNPDNVVSLSDFRPREM